MRRHPPARIGDLARAGCPLYPGGRVLVGNVPYTTSRKWEVDCVGRWRRRCREDKFGLLVGTVVSVQSVESLPHFGEVILFGKELADVASDVADEAARERAEECRRDLHRLTTIGLTTGLALVLILVTIQTNRVGFTPDLWLVPPVASIEFACLATWLSWFGGETNGTLLLIAAVTTTTKLFAGTYFFGPFVGEGAIGLCSNFAVALLALPIVVIEDTGDGAPTKQSPEIAHSDPE